MEKRCLFSIGQRFFIILNYHKSFQKIERSLLKINLCMRALFLIVVCIILAVQANAQKKEFSLTAQTGLFRFAGSGTDNSTFLNVGSNTYTNNPYGNSSAFSFGVGVNFQKVTSQNVIFGLQLKYESLASKIILERAEGDIAEPLLSGRTIFRNNFISLTPVLGKRFELIKNQKTDILVGLDFSKSIQSTERYSGTTTLGEKISGTKERDILSFDVRPSIQLTQYFGKMGISIGYVYGLANYRSNLAGKTNGASVRYFYTGVVYTFKR
jgi:hypothetical protein